MNRDKPPGPLSRHVACDNLNHPSDVLADAMPHFQRLQNIGPNRSCKEQQAKKVCDGPRQNLVMARYGDKEKKYYSNQINKKTLILYIIRLERKKFLSV